MFLHGNVSDARFWGPTLEALAPAYRCVAPDLRGYGGTESRPVDATRGLGDFADDLHALAGTLDGTGSGMHVVGWSFGGGIALRYCLDHPERVASLVLVNPIPPYGFGGTKDAEGTPCWPDYAGSGGGAVDDGFVEVLREGDRRADDGPLAVLRDHYTAPSTDLPADLEATLLDGMLSTSVGPGNYPGDSADSENWPGMVPGTTGERNAISPKYCDLSPVAGLDAKPPVLWIRGAGDRVVADESHFDYGYLGREGIEPGWPGADAFPPQPMLAQTRAVLDDYADRGGSYEEVVVDDAGHSPQVERPATFVEHLGRFLAAAGN